MTDLVAALRAAGCVFAEQEAALLEKAASSPDALDGMLSRRLRGEPLEVILGWAEFCGMRVAVGPGVFVPRTRSGLLVDIAVGTSPRVVVDLCCGSGAIGAAIRASVPGVEVYGFDIDPVAVGFAIRNGVRSAVSDLFDAVPESLRGRIDVVVMSPPYVPTAHLVTMPSEARNHEPAQALDGGADGLAIVRRALEAAAPWLVPDGLFIFDVGRRQADSACRLAEALGWTATVQLDDERDSTAVICRVRSDNIL